MNHCIKCESQVDYQKYCDPCVELYGLQDKQDTEFWKNWKGEFRGDPIRPDGAAFTRQEYDEALAKIFYDDMEGKTSQIKGTIRKFKKISETAPLSNLYKVKGHSGLWYSKGKPAKNMIRMLKYGSDEATTVDTKSLRGPLVGWYVEALDNCQNHFNNEVVDIDFIMAGADTDGLREKIRPNYDERHFERKDLRQVLVFYNAIVIGSKAKSKV